MGVLNRERGPGAQPHRSCVGEEGQRLRCSAHALTETRTNILIDFCVTKGTPEEIAAASASHTGQFLRARSSASASAA